MFSKEIYKQRRNKLRKTVGSGLILLLGNDESPMNYADNGYHFRQDSTFLYFFGLNQPYLAGILDCETGDDMIFGNDLTVEDFVWMGPQPSISAQSLQVGVEHSDDISSLIVLLKEGSEKGRKIHFLPPYRPENKIKLFDWLKILPNKSKDAVSLDLIMGVVNQRNYKSPEEISEIRKACDVSTDMHTLAMRMAKPGVTEAKISAAVQQLSVAAGGQISFPVIATINGQTLHNHYHGNILKDGDMFLLDAGAETAMGYAGDLSSTVPVNGKFSTQQKEIYSICLDSHNTAISMLKPGIPFKEVYFESVRVIISGLRDIGLMKGNVEDALRNMDKGTDDHRFGEVRELTADELKKLEGEIDKALRQGGMLAGRMGGNIPRVIGELLEPQVDWREVLREFVQSAMRGKDEYTWRKMSKPYLANDMYIPSMHSETMGELVVAIDTSGSIDNEQISAFASELASICDVCNPDKVRVLWWDTKVHGEQVFEGNYQDIAKMLKPMGGGGTHVGCVSDYMIKSSINAEVLVIFTDGYVEHDIKWEVSAPTMWFVTQNGSFDPPSGGRMVKVVD